MSRISEYDRSAVEEIMSGEGDWMSAQIMRLIAKADPVTREQFRLGFPDHVALYEAWHRRQS